MRLGVVILPELSWTQARLRWRRAEELGFDHAWTYDHLAWRNLRDSAWFGAVPFLTAAATVTERIPLGTLVASPNFRHPVSFARELLALDDISAGRFVLGIGAGGSGWDATILGQAEWSARERMDRFEEFVTLLDRLLRQREVSFAGRYYSANDARSHPGCVQQPRLPFAVAAAGPRAMQLAARFGEIWVTIGDRTAARPLDPLAGAAVVRAQMDRLDRICADVGRDPQTLRRLVLCGPSLEEHVDSLESLRAMIAAYESVGVTDLVIHWPRPSEPYAGDETTFERVVSAWRDSRRG